MSELSSPPTDQAILNEAAKPPIEDLLYDRLRFKDAPQAERLKAGEPMALDPARPLAEYEGFTVLAEVDAAHRDDNPFLVLDLRKTPKDAEGYRNPGFANGDRINTDFLLISKDFGGEAQKENPNVGIKGIRHGQTFTVGKDHLRDRFGYYELLQGGPQVSPDHFRVGVDDQGRVTIEDLNTKWGTYVRQAAPAEADPLDGPTQPRNEADIPTRPRSEIVAELQAAQGDKLRGSLKEVGDKKARAGQWWSEPSVEHRAKIDPKDHPEFESSDKPKEDEWWQPPKATPQAPSTVGPQAEGHTDNAEQWWQQPHVAAEVAKNNEGEVVPEEVIEEVGEVADEGAGVQLDPAAVAELDAPVSPGAEEANQETSSPVEGQAQSELPPAVEQEPTIPELSEVFASPENFEKALSDPDGDPDFRRDLQSVYTAWQELKLAGLTNEVWNEHIAPKLGKVAEEAPGLWKDALETKDSVTKMAEGLRRLSDAVRSNRHDEIADVVHRYRFGDLRSELEYRLKGLTDNDRLSQPARALDIEHWDGDDRIRRVQRGVERGFNPDTADEMLDAMRHYTESGATTLAQIRDELREEQKRAGSMNWRRRSEDIEMLTRFGRMSQQDMGREVNTLNQALEDLFHSMRNGRYNEGDIEYSARLANNLVDPIEAIERMSNMARQAAEQAKQ